MKFFTSLSFKNNFIIKILLSVKQEKFLKNSGALAFGGLVLTKEMRAAFLKQAPTHAVGLQLYTLFNVIDADVKGSLKKVADIGYKEIESAFSKRADIMV